MKQNRKRGGASHPCPHCGSDTHVRTTWRTDGNKVTRERECNGRRHHRYFTVEEFFEDTGKAVVQKRTSGAQLRKVSA